MTVKASFRVVDLPAVREVEAAPKGRLLYLWMQDGRSGMLDLSDWNGYLRERWDTEGFNRWKEDYGFACWGEDGHISPDFCSDELIEMPYSTWREIISAVSQSR